MSPSLLRFRSRKPGVKTLIPFFVGSRFRSSKQDIFQCRRKKLDTLGRKRYRDANVLSTMATALTKQLGSSTCDLWTFLCFTFFGPFGVCVSKKSTTHGSSFRDFREASMTVPTGSDLRSGDHLSRRTKDHKVIANALYSTIKWYMMKLCEEIYRFA